jgi:hypothetical protein
LPLPSVTDIRAGTNRIRGAIGAVAVEELVALAVAGLLVLVAAEVDAAEFDAGAFVTDGASCATLDSCQHHPKHKLRTRTARTEGRVRVFIGASQALKD